MSKEIIKIGCIEQTIDRLEDRFCILDFVEVFKKKFPAEWEYLVDKYDLYGSGTKYSALTYLSNRLSLYSRSLKQNRLLPTPKGWVPKESKFLRRTTKEERKYFGSSWIVIFNKK